MSDNAPVLPVVRDISAKAAEYPFAPTVARLFFTSLLGVFFSAGWLFGAAWYSLVFAVLWTGRHLRWSVDAVNYGFRQGAHVKTAKK